MKALITALLLSLALAGAAQAQQASAAQDLIVCGWDEVYVLDVTDKANPRKIWSWRAAGRSDVPDEMERLFNTTDDCKPVEGGRRILITSSGGGVALVDREQDRVLFHGRAANAHSAAMLPGGLIAVAASQDAQGRGDRLILFDAARSGEPLWTDEMPHGHGAVWDERRGVLWALADEDLRIYRLQDWDTDRPKLERMATILLPEGGGHDLYPVPGTSQLTLTTSNHVWLFDRDSRTFLLHPDLGEHRSVKSISIHPATRQMVYVQAEGENWWAERLHFLNSEETIHTPGEHHYKARWNISIDD